MTVRLVNTNENYGIVAISLHWVMAVMIFGIFFLGVYMTRLDYMHPLYTRAPHLHKSFGLLVLFLLICRTVWMIVNVKPRAVPMPDWERMTASLVHMSFYFLLFGITLSGYMIPTANGKGIELFNWFLVPAILSGIELQEDIFGAIHWYLAFFTIALAGLHTLAALKHHFVERDASLMRILGVETK